MTWKSVAVLAASFCLAASSTLEGAPLSRTTRMVASDTVQSRATMLRTGSGILKQIWFGHGGTVRITWSTASRVGPSRSSLSRARPMSAIQ
jgi:hypothetical protein